MPANFDGHKFVKDFNEAWNAKDASRVLEHYAENVEFKDPSQPQVSRGKDALRKNTEKWFQGFDNIRFDVKDVIQTGNKAAILFEASGRHSGELEIAPGERIPATNKNVKMEIAEFVTLDDNGKITRDHTIFDAASMMTQLGLLPQGGAEQSQAAGKRGETPPVRR